MDFSSIKTPPASAVDSLLTVTRTALGLGVGLLVAGRMKDSLRTKTAVALLSVGVVSAVPFVYELILKQINRPESERAMNRQLRSIRDDSGMEADYEVV